MRLIFALLFSILLAGCSALELRNLGKSTATTAVTYAIAGPVPAVVNAATSMAYDEIIPEQEELKEVQTKEQAIAYVAESFFMNVLYGFVAWMVITLIALPLMAKWGYKKAKKEEKQDG